MKAKQKSCKQCGICCSKGGPAIHGDDLSLIIEGKIPLKNLITIRRGEFAYNPILEKNQAIKHEIVKIRGIGGKWTCCYFNSASKSCGIYSSRPVACKALKCWDTTDSLTLIETDLLSRLDIIEEGHSFSALIKEYEELIPPLKYKELPDKLTRNSGETIKFLEDLVNHDLRFRNKTVNTSSEILDAEMFLFGRPLFQILAGFGITVFQKGAKLCLGFEESR